MARRSPRKKAISPETVAISDDEQQFMAVASDDQYVALWFLFVVLSKAFLLLLSIELTRMWMNFNTPMRTRGNPSLIAAMEKRTPSPLASMVLLFPFSERTVPHLQFSNLRTMTCKLPLLCFPLWISYYVCIYSIEITPPPTPSPVKAAGGKKRAIAINNSDDDDVFVPRYDTPSFCYIQIIVLSDNFHTLVLQGTVLKRPVLKSHPLP
jgi:hypothetical protein